jgi:branched-chain amino acid transport system ATP-binding protein
MEPEIIFETVKLRKEFGALVAVDDVSMKVRKNSLHAIIGPNGAGKTTFFNLLSGNIEPTGGHVIYKGHDITHQPVHRTIHFGIGRSFQITNIFPNLTVFENVRLACQALGKDNFKFWQAASVFKKYEERTWAVLERVGLKARAFTLARTLPHGDQRKLELGMILAPDSEVLLLDEPTAGMAAEQVPELIALIQDPRRQQDRDVGGTQYERGYACQYDHGHAPGAGAGRGTPRDHREPEVQTAYLAGYMNGIVSCHELASSRFKTSTPLSASTIFCKGLPCRCPKARLQRCWGATAPVRPPRSNPSWG